MPDKATTVTANWLGVSVEVSLDGNGGVLNTEKIRVNYDSSYGTLPTPMRFYHTFAGWFTAAEGGTEVTAATKVTDAKAHTLYAHWTKNNKVPPFTDIKTTDWFYDHVVYVYNAGLMQGTEETLFSPYQKTSRGMFISILYRLEGKPVVHYARSFKDVDATKYYEKAVTWAAKNGIVSGYDDGTFRPEADISREHLAMMLFNYAKYKGYDTSGNAANLTRFFDFDKIYPPARNAMAWAVTQRLFFGHDDGTLAPNDGALRSETAAILHRFCDKYVE